MAIAPIVKVVFASFALAIMGLCLAACGGEVKKTDTTPLGTYEIIASSKVQTGVQEFDAQDLLAAREEPTGTLRAAYDAALARFTEKHGREPQDDLETAAAICDWVSFTLRHPNFYPADPSLPRVYPYPHDQEYNAFYWDPVEIIRYTLSFDPNDSANWPSPYCSHQNFAAAGIMNYAGLHARVCSTLHHDGLEYYSWKYKKWIWCDSTFNDHYVLPRSDGTFEPLGAMELQELTLFGGIENVQLVEHGFPDGPYSGYNYLGIEPHGFRRYGPLFHMNTLNGGGRDITIEDIIVSILPIPPTYVPDAGEIVEFELDPNDYYFRKPKVQDPLILDVPLNALTLGDVVSPQRDMLVINLRTWLPHATRFEVQYGEGASWQTLEVIPKPISTGKTSSSFAFPWSSGVVRFRAMDGVGNTTESLTILLKEF